MHDIELYNKVLGIKEPWAVIDVSLDLKQRIVTIIVAYDNSKSLHCPVCNTESPFHDAQKRRWRHLDTCQLRTIIECDVPRTMCKEHGAKQIPVPWAEPLSHFTALFEALTIAWLKETSISGVAELLGLTWDEAAGIQERAVNRGLKRRHNQPVKHMAIDETSFQKHHEYVTAIIDSDRDIVLDVLDDRTAESLDNWLKNNKGYQIDSVKTVSMDMWDPFILAIRNNVSQADEKICFDRFHVAQHFGKALDKVRAQEHRAFLSDEGESPLTRTKTDWQRNSGRTDNRSRREFMELTRSKLKTARAWAIKETAAQLWDYINRGSAERAWNNMLAWIRRCRLEPVKKVGRLIKSFLWGILNAIIAKVTNAIAESKNARIQRIKRMACGFRNRGRFRMAILFHLGGLDLMPKSLGNTI